jgi:protein ImuB
MLWACLRFPQIALDAIHIGNGRIGNDRIGADDFETPFAVIDGPVQRRSIVLANAAACRTGVRSGQPLAAAQAICPALSIASRDEVAERQALEAIALWAYRFSADVSILATDAIYLEIGASLSLFGGLAALFRRLRFEIAAFGFEYSLAAAATAAAAHVLAVQADGIAIPRAAPLVNALGAIPLATSGLDDDAVAALRGMGFRHLRDLFRLPRAELTRRIGQDALDHLDRMRGFAPETLIRYRPADRFERRLEFAFGIESQDALAFALQRLGRELAAFLVARDGGVERFTLVLGHERGASTRIDVGLLAPQRDAVALFELARTRLDRIELVAPVHALTLRADDLPPLCPLHVDFFETGRREALDWPALAERLRARLGDEALHGLRCVADHRPGRAWRFAPPNETPSRDDACGTRSARGIRNSDPAALEKACVEARKQTRPFWLLKHLVRLRAAPLRLLTGPERIESGWWDDRDNSRDYYVIETHLGQRAWAFVPAGAATGWTLHGWFA